MVAYRDGIAVTYDEAEIALGYIKEMKNNSLSPKNIDLEGTVLVAQEPIFIQLTKKESNVSLENIGAYNIPRFFVAMDSITLASAPIALDDFSPYESIIYSDFQINYMLPNIVPIGITGIEGNPSISILHDFALKNNIPFHAIVS